MDYIEFCFERGVLKVATGENRWTLKSGRKSWFFFNSGAFDDGNSLEVMGDAYANAIVDSGVEIDMVFGPSYKGTPIAVAAAGALARKGVNVKWTTDRKEEKSYGDATGASETREGRARRLFVGAKPYDGVRLCIADDVITDGATKEEAVTKIDSVAEVSYAALVVACDRQEKNHEGVIAGPAFAEKHGMEFVAVVTATDVIDYLCETGRMGTELETEIRDYNSKYCAYDLSVLR